MKKTLLALCAAFACMLPAAASAQYYNYQPSCAPCDPCAVPCDPCAAPCDPWYLFAGVVHRGRFHERYQTIAAGVETQHDSQLSNWGWQIFLGYNFVPCFGLELGYVDLARGKLREHSDVSTITTPLAGHYREYLIPLRGNFSYNFCDLKLSALFGVHYYNSYFNASGGTTTFSGRRSGVDFNFGAAIEYRFVEWLGLRLDLSRYYIKGYEDSYQDAATANLVTYF